MIMPTMMFIGNLNYVIIAVVGGLRVASGTMNLGDVQAFIQYSRMFTQPLTQVASMANLLQSGVASAERVFEVLDAEEQTPDATRRPEPGPRCGSTSSTSRSPTTPDKPLITDLSLRAEPGQTVAIVGPTGAGKTTLVNLIMRFYELNGGRITAGRRGHLRRCRGRLCAARSAWCCRTPGCSTAPSATTSRYGRPDATEDEIHAAAEATYVDRFVHSLPDGYDTVIDEEGSNISAGEKQLITIARAFLADPALLILDEATSSVDTRTEVLVQHAMAALRSDRTSFVIAHRLSTIRDADVILVMENGRIVEQGNHSAAGGPRCLLRPLQRPVLRPRSTRRRPRQPSPRADRHRSHSSSFARTWCETYASKAENRPSAPSWCETYPPPLSGEDYERPTRKCRKVRFIRGPVGRRVFGTAWA